MKRFDQGKALKKLHPIDDMEIEYDANEDEHDIKELVAAKDKVDVELLKPKVSNLSQAQLENYNQKMEIKKEIQDLEKQIKSASQMIMCKDLVDMKRVMRRLDMVDKNDVPHLKGKVAASLSAADEILATELIFSGFFQELTPVQMAAVLSCLVYTDTKSEGEPPKDESLAEPFAKLQEVASMVATVMEESNIPGR